MRRFFCALVALLLIGTVALAAGKAPAGDYIRLHVVAGDDSAAAQALKLTSIATNRMIALILFMILK